MSPSPKYSELGRPLHIMYTLNSTELTDAYEKNKTPNASTVYRILLPFAAMAKDGFAEFAFNDRFDIDKKSMYRYSIEANPIIDWADVVVFPRIITAPLSEHKKLLEALKGYKKVIAFEHDDYYFTLGRSHYAKEHIDAESLESVKETVAVANLITSTNPILNTETIKVSGYKLGQVYEKAAIPNAINLEDWTSCKRYRKPHSDIRICLAGATNHFIDWINILPVLSKIKQKYGKKVTFHVLGLNPRWEEFRPAMFGDKYNKDFYVDVKTLGEGFKKIGAKLYPYADFRKYPQMLNEVTPDIGIITTTDAIYDVCKSTLKFIDYTMSGAAIVCSKYPPYTDELDESVLLWATDHEDWEKQLCRLVDDEGLRRNLRKAAEKKVEDTYTMEKVLPMWKDAFKNAYIKLHG